MIASYRLSESIKHAPKGKLHTCPNHQSCDSVLQQVEIVLSETETIFMLDIPGTCVDVTTDEAETVKKTNEEYETVSISMYFHACMH